MPLTYSTDERSTRDLQGLVRANLDAWGNLLAAARHVEADELGAFLADAARTREANAAQLQSLVALEQMDVPTTGTWRGRLRRWWTATRGALPDARAALLESIERSEAALLRRYEHALAGAEGTDLQELYAEQQASVREVHGRVRSALQVRAGGPG